MTEKQKDVPSTKIPGNSPQRPQWLTRFIARLERGERRMTNPQKKLVLIAFTLAVGTYFMYLVISAVVSDGRAFDASRQTLRRPTITAPIPPPADTIQNKKLLP